MTNEEKREWKARVSKLESWKLVGIYTDLNPEHPDYHYMFDVLEHLIFERQKIDQ